MPVGNRGLKIVVNTANDVFFTFHEPVDRGNRFGFLQMNEYRPTGQNVRLHCKCLYLRRFHLTVFVFWVVFLSKSQLPLAEWCSYSTILESMGAPQNGSIWAPKDLSRAIYMEKTTKFQEIQEWDSYKSVGLSPELDFIRCIFIGFIDDWGL